MKEGRHRRRLSLLLVIVMLFGLLGGNVYADQPQEDSGEMIVSESEAAGVNDAAQSLTVAYEANNGSDLRYEGSGLKAGDCYTVLSAEGLNYTRRNYHFTGWNTNADGTGTSYTPGDTVTLAGNIILFAQWELAGAHMVTYHANVGPASQTSQDVVNNGDRYTVLDKDTAFEQSSQPAMTLTEWNTKANGTGISYHPGDILTIEGDVTLYAIWNFGNSRFTITYMPLDANNKRKTDIADPNFGYTVLTGAEAGMSSGTRVVAEWNTVADGSGISYLPGEIVRLHSGMMLYAQWYDGVSKFAVTYDANGAPDGLSKHTTGKVFDFLGQHTVEELDTTGIVSNTGTFLGWNTKANGSGISYEPGDAIVMRGNVTLFAQWMYTVKYDANYDDDTPVYKDEARVANRYTVLDEKVTFENDLVRGLALKSWNTKPDGSGISYKPGNALTINGDITLYAIWEHDGSAYANAIYYASFNGTAWADKDIIPGTYHILDITDTDIDYGNRKFIGWNTMKNGSGISYQPGDTVFVKNYLMLYAQWAD